MGKIKVKRYLVSDFGTNCYFAINEDTKEMLVIDPGENAPMLSQEIQKEQLKPVAVLLTHGHLDHAKAAEDLAKKYEMPIYAYKTEKETLENPRMNLSSAFGKSESYHADRYVIDGELVSLLGCSIEVLFTPGHTPGGCCYYFKEEKILFSGDTLFCQSVGRSDFPGGSSSTLIRSIREKLLNLPEEVVVYPGH
ncbi:MAG: MBL fold metallo-hydrolase, partial [Lachnospiraceae bacterium]